MNIRLAQVEIRKNYKTDNAGAVGNDNRMLCESCHYQNVSENIVGDLQDLPLAAPYERIAIKIDT